MHAPAATHLADVSAKIKRELFSEHIDSNENERAKMTQDRVIQAHKHSINHRQELLASTFCGCFFCGTLFTPNTIVEWTDKLDGTGQTALCPRCGIDSVLGDASGYPITPRFLKQMHAHWF